MICVYYCCLLLLNRANRKRDHLLLSRCISREPRRNLNVCAVPISALRTLDQSRHVQCSEKERCNTISLSLSLSLLGTVVHVYAKRLLLPRFETLYHPWIPTSRWYLESELNSDHRRNCRRLTVKGVAWIPHLIDQLYLIERVYVFLLPAYETSSATHVRLQDKMHTRPLANANNKV